MTFQRNIFFKIGLFIVVSLGISVGCKSGNKKEALVVDSDAIIFFTISKNDYENLRENDKTEVDEVLTDHYTYFERIKYFFSKAKVKVLLAAENKIIFKTSKMQMVTFQRTMNQHVVGVILFHPDKKPLILYGIFTDSDILDKIKEYHAEWTNNR